MIELTGKESMEQLIQNGYFIDLDFDEDPESQLNLYCAVYLEDLEEVEEIMKKIKKRSAAVENCAKLGKKDLLDYYIAQEENIEDRKMKISYAMGAAAQQGNGDIVKHIMEKMNASDSNDYNEGLQDSDIEKIIQAGFAGVMEGDKESNATTNFITEFIEITGITKDQMQTTKTMSSDFSVINNSARSKIKTLLEIESIGFDVIDSNSDEYPPLYYAVDNTNSLGILILAGVDTSFEFPDIDEGELETVYDYVEQNNDDTHKKLNELIIYVAYKQNQNGANWEDILDKLEEGLYNPIPKLDDETSILILSIIPVEERQGLTNQIIANLGDRYTDEHQQTVAFFQDLEGMSISDKVELYAATLKDNKGLFKMLYDETPANSIVKKIYSIIEEVGIDDKIILLKTFSCLQDNILDVSNMLNVSKRDVSKQVSDLGGLISHGETSQAVVFDTIMSNFTSPNQRIGSKLKDLLSEDQSIRLTKKLSEHFGSVQNYVCSEEDMKNEEYSSSKRDYAAWEESKLSNSVSQSSAEPLQKKSRIK